MFQRRLSLFVGVGLGEPLEEDFEREGRDGVALLARLLLPVPEYGLADNVLVVQHVEQHADKARLMLHLVVERLHGKQRLQLVLVIAVDEFGEDGTALLEQCRVELALYQTAAAHGCD